MVHELEAFSRGPSTDLQNTFENGLAYPAKEDLENDILWSEIRVAVDLHGETVTKLRDDVVYISGRRGWLSILVPGLSKKTTRMSSPSIMVPRSRLYIHTFTVHDSEVL